MHYNVIQSDCDISMLKDLKQINIGTEGNQLINDSTSSRDDDAKHEDKSKNVETGGNTKKGSSSKEEVMESEGYRLLEEHTHCEAIMDEQHHRLDQVHQNVYSLLSEQNVFIQSIESWREREVSGKNEYTKLL